MAEVTTTLENLVIRDVTARGELTKVYEVVADGRKFSTFKRPLAEKAAPLKGTLVTIEYTEKQKGEFTNYYLDDIRQALPGATGATETPSQDTLDTQAAHSASNGTAALTASPELTASLGQQKKDISIARAVALKAAVETATGLQLVEADSDSILRIANVYVSWLLNGENNPFADLQEVFSETTSEPVDAKGELVKF